jgi:hypothetical protein
VFESDRLTARVSRLSRVVHQGQRVVSVKARLVPPWFSTGVVLASEPGAHVVTWIGARPRLLRALEDAGFEVEQVETWFSLTGDRAEKGRCRPDRAPAAGVSRDHGPVATTLCPVPGDSRGGEPQNWRIGVPQSQIDLYLELLNESRPLSVDEARMMVELVDAWRSLEQSKHIALKSAEAATPPEA